MVTAKHHYSLKLLSRAPRMLQIQLPTELQQCRLKLLIAITLKHDEIFLQNSTFLTTVKYSKSVKIFLLNQTYN
uniref:Uncharacterized protein n=1 Tax=Rhizophora mucronata TaxID=61149 RepID=A0A2P2PVA6_RHIMU